MQARDPGHAALSSPRMASPLQPRRCPSRSLHLLERGDPESCPLRVTETFVHPSNCSLEGGDLESGGSSVTNRAAATPYVSINQIGIRESELDAWANRDDEDQPLPVVTLYLEEAGPKAVQSFRVHEYVIYLASNLYKAMAKFDMASSSMAKENPSHAAKDQPEKNRERSLCIHSDLTRNPR